MSCGTCGRISRPKPGRVRRTSFLSKRATTRGQKKTLHHLLTREITHANMFMKALGQMGKLDDPFFGNIPPDETVKLVFNLSKVRTNGVLGMKSQTSNTSFPSIRTRATNLPGHPAGRTSSDRAEGPALTGGPFQPPMRRALS